MRISYWSSDVCSSDLLFADVEGLGLPAIIADTADLTRPGLAEALDRAGSAVIEIGPRLDGVRVMRGDVRTAMQTSPGVAIEMLTSGTTGTPKRVPLSRESFDAKIGRAHV